VATLVVSNGERLPELNDVTVPLPPPLMVLHPKALVVVLNVSALVAPEHEPKMEPIVV